MAEGAFEFFVEVRQKGTLLGSTRASLTACLEDAMFRAVLEGRISNDGDMSALAVQPRWRDGASSSATGLTISHGGGVCLGSYGLEPFAPQAQALLAELTREQNRSSGDPLDWDLVARPIQSGPRRFSARVRRKPYPMEEAELPDVPPGAFRAEIGERLLEEIQARVVESGSVECAGLLYGRLLRDPRRRAGLLQITRAVDVEPGPGGASGFHFAFGVDSLTSARRAANDQQNGTIPAGWYHSHPACAACEKQKICSAQMVYFSADDIDVHSTAFPSAYQVGLVAGKVRNLPASEPGFRLYGWAGGRVEELGYRRVRESRESKVVQWIEPSWRIPS